MIEQRNLILAVVLSIGILLAFQFFYELPRIEQTRRQQTTEQAQRPTPGEMEAAAPPEAHLGAPPAPGAPSVPGGVAAPGAIAQATRSAALQEGRRVRIESPRLSGSISLRGGRIDDLSLADYRETLDPGSPEIVLLSPEGAPKPYYVDFGWGVDGRASLKLPDADTPWQAKDRALTPESPLTLTWDNGEGLRFVRTLTLDDNYVLSLTQRVENSGARSVTLYPYALIRRVDTPEVTRFFILHEGALGVFDGTLDEVNYDEGNWLGKKGMIEEGRICVVPAADETSGQCKPIEKPGGWIGFTDKYWLTALIPDQNEPYSASFNYSSVEGRDVYQVDYWRGGRAVPPGGSVEVTNRVFAGAKEVSLLDEYRQTLGIVRFDLAIDWGWFYFLTRPIFWVLDFFNGLIGNFGLAILLLTVLIKLLFFPLANKSYKAMGKMKKLQPEVTKMRERFGDDRQQLNQEMMALYKREKVNPMAGCLPMVIQIPVFFALYKVLFVTIEMRHAPFFGWIQDLSAQDPTTWLNLFGLIPWDPPVLALGFFTLNLGIWPLLMGLSMFLQMRLNPQPADPVQAKLFMFMPVFFTFMLASFPAGLVIYWTCNNVLSMAQQWIIMRRAGVRP